MRITHLVCVLVLVLIAEVDAQVRYTITPIAPPVGSAAYYNIGRDINNRGEIAGQYGARLPDGISSRYGAFVFSDAVGTLDVSVPGYISSPAAGINDAGQIALSTSTAANQSQDLYRYTPGVGYELLASESGNSSETRAINSSGQVTGFIEGPVGLPYAFRYTDGIGLQNVGMSYNASQGFAINDAGWVAGWADGSAFLYRGDDGNLDLVPGAAYGLNNAGNVVGRTSVVPGHPTAFVYLNGEMLILGDHVFGQPVLNDINNQDLAVGLGITDGRQHALFWSEALLAEGAGGFVDLNTLVGTNSGWTLISATAINDLGQITGLGTLDGQPMAYRLDPVPEPSIWALFGLGAAGLWTASRYQKGRATSHVRKA